MRYFKPYFKTSYWFHVVSGIFILIMTLFFCIIGIAWLDWSVSSHWHAYLGMVVTFAVTAVPASGLYVSYVKTRLRWKTDTISFVKKNHRYFGFFMILFCQLEIYLGVSMCTHVGDNGRNLGISQMVIFYSIFFLIELAY